MDPEDFLTREEFEALDVEERDTYGRDLAAGLAAILNSEAPVSRQLDFIGHYLDVQKWTLTPDQWEFEWGSKLWQMMWERADEVVTTFEGALASGKLSDREQAWVEAHIEEARTFARFKRDLESFPSIEPSDE